MFVTQFADTKKGLSFGTSSRSLFGVVVLMVLWRRRVIELVG